MMHLKTLDADEDFISIDLLKLEESSDEQEKSMNTIWTLNEAGICCGMFRRERAHASLKAKNSSNETSETTSVRNKCILI